MVDDRHKVDWSRFDRKSVVGFTGNKDTRVLPMKEELDRVGIDVVNWRYQFPNPFMDVLLKAMRHVPEMTNAGYMNCSIGHYSEIATAYHLGCGHALVMEDDIRFAKDLSFVKSCVESLPRDYDIAMFDCFPRRESGDEKAYFEWRENRSANEFWASFDRMYSCGCYAVSRRGMERLMFCVEAVEKAPRIFKMRPFDHFLDRSIVGKDAKLYFCRKNACIQRPIGKSSTPDGWIEEGYSKIGIDFDDYQGAANEA